MLTVRLNRKPSYRVDKSFDNLVDNFFNMPAFFNKDFNGFETKGWAPVNVKETDKAFRLELIAPGFEKSDFNISLEADLLTISATKKEENTEGGNEKESKIIRNEYVTRSFKRTFTIDEKIDATNIEASYINGVLILNLPRKEEVKEAAKEIEIK
jgi:HSP20 family protein